MLPSDVLLRDANEDEREKELEYEGLPDSPGSVLIAERDLIAAADDDAPSSTPETLVFLLADEPVRARFPW